MGYPVNFYRFAKKANSTKRPTAVPDVTYECEILPGTSILAPTLKLNTNFLDPSNLTYAFIPTLTRYYFVSNWYYDRGLWQCDLQTDVLASYKPQIGNFSLYVLRSSYEMDGRIVDKLYPIKTGLRHAVTQSTSFNPLAANISNGYFVVGIINGDSAAIGTTSYYVFTNAEFRNFLSFLLGSTSYMNSPAEIGDDLLKCLVNPTQYIVSCIWLPLQPFMGAALTTINIGWWSVNVSCHRLSDYVRVATTGSITIPKHPDALTRGYYLLQEPFSSYYLVIPPFGAINLPADALVDSDELNFIYDVDAVTGMGRLTIRNSPTNGTPCNLEVIYAQVGVPIALAQNAPQITIPEQIFSDNPGPSETPSGFLYPLFKAVSENKEQIGSIASALIAHKMPVQVIGGNGGFINSYLPVTLNASFAALADDNNAEWGRPLCRIKTLNTIPGFIQCAEADFELNCTAEERTEISRFLTGGFFYE